MNRKNLTIALLFIVCVVVVMPRQATAIPAFAREHKISCTTCHTPFPRLKEFGAEFAANGFTMPAVENPRNFVNTGDDELLLNKTFPIAARFDLYGIYEDTKDERYKICPLLKTKYLKEEAFLTTKGRCNIFVK